MKRLYAQRKLLVAVTCSLVLAASGCGSSESAATTEAAATTAAETTTVAAAEATTTAAESETQVAENDSKYVQGTIAQTVYGTIEGYEDGGSLHWDPSENFAGKLLRN